MAQFFSSILYGYEYGTWARNYGKSGDFVIFTFMIVFTYFVFRFAKKVFHNCNSNTSNQLFSLLFFCGLSLKTIVIDIS